MLRASSRHTSLRAPLIAALILLGAPAAHAAEDALTQAVTEFGTLNGVILACKQHALTARMREIMVDTVPKERNVGELFEDATSKSFLNFGSDGKTCPDGKTLAEQIDLGRGKLQKAVGKGA